MWTLGVQVGIALQRYPIKRILTMAMYWNGACSIGFGCSSEPSALLLTRVGVGMSQVHLIN